MGITATIIGAVTSGIGFIQQQSAASEAKDAQQRQAQAQREQAQIAQRQADINNSRQVRAAIRQARLARAVVINQGANAGTLGSSGVLGGTSSIDSQANSNLNTFGQLQQLNTEATAAQGRQADAVVAGAEAQADYAMGGALGKVGGGLFDMGGGFKTIFDTVKK